jgi:hypothetical protein
MLNLSVEGIYCHARHYSWREIESLSGNLVGVQALTRGSEYLDIRFIDGRKLRLLPYSLVESERRFRLAPMFSGFTPAFSAVLALIATNRPDLVSTEWKLLLDVQMRKLAVGAMRGNQCDETNTKSAMHYKCPQCGNPAASVWKLMGVGFCGSLVCPHCNTRLGFHRASSVLLVIASAFAMPVGGAMLAMWMGEGSMA